MAGSRGDWPVAGPKASPHDTPFKVESHAIDLHVGSRLRLRRTLLGISQEGLSRTVGLTFQQIQKYERGANRISASRLHQLGEALDVPVSFFFDGLADDQPARAAVSDDADPLARRETRELIQTFYRIPNPVVRRRLFELVKAAANDRSSLPEPAEGAP